MLLAGCGSSGRPPRQAHPRRVRRHRARRSRVLGLIVAGLDLVRRGGDQGRTGRPSSRRALRSPSGWRCCRTGIAVQGADRRSVQVVAGVLGVGEGDQGDERDRHAGHGDYSILVGGAALCPTRTASRCTQSGTWKVGDKSFCGLLGLEKSSGLVRSGAARPPARPASGRSPWRQRPRWRRRPAAAVARRAGRAVHAAVPDLPGQHDRQRGARQHPGRPARERLVAAVGGQRLRADLRQHHAGLRDDRRRVRPQDRHAVRGRGVLRRLAAVRAGPERRRADRRARRSWVSARRPASPARCPCCATCTPSSAPGPGDRGLGGGVRAGARGRAGARRGAGRRLELARDLLVQPGLRPGRAGRGRDRAAGERGSGRAPGGHRGHAARRGRPVGPGVRGHPRGERGLRLARGDRPVLRRRGRGRGVLLVGEPGRAPDPGSAVPARARVRDRERRRRSARTSPPSRSSSSPRCTWRRWSATPGTRSRWCSCR